jgi:outer membrane protein assembly factor BamA
MPVSFHRYSLLVLLFLIGVCRQIPAQDTLNFPVHIDRVYVVGNEHTKSYIILREIPFTFPDTLNEADLKLIQNRIQNLFLFNRVELMITPTDEGNALIIMVTESWYFFPVPLLFINEHDWSKISYGLQFSHYNFRGRNEKLRLGGWLGYNPSYYFSYFNPWIGHNLRLIAGTGLYRKRVQNKIFDFDENLFGFNVTVGRRFSLKMDTRLNFYLTRVELPAKYLRYTLSGDGVDLVPTISVQFRWDYRDLFEYPKKGFYFSYTLQRTGFNSRQPQFWRLNADNRVYIRLYKGLSVGARQLFVYNRGDLPIYDRTFIGFNERIRGYFNRVLPNPRDFREYPSPKISLSTIEFRFPLLPIRYFSIEEGPLIPSLYQDLKFGISTGIFMDSGIAWQKSQQFALSNFYTGYGAGIHIHLPYVYVLRLEYAVNDKGKTQFIIDAGVSF